jgi:tripartite-type tricarboxylate transporter receptor subunit TctC
MSKVHFIGNMATLNSVIAMSGNSPVKTLADMKTKQAVLGAAGVLSQTYMVPALLNHFNGAKFKIVLGFQGTSQMDLAIERGEIDGRGGQWKSFVVSRPDWIKSGKIFPFLQIGMEEDEEMKGAPMLTSLASDDTQRAIYRLLSQSPRLSRAVWAPPEIPPDRTAILRKAFAATMEDQAFLAEAGKSKLDITPTPPEAVQQAVREMADTPKRHLDALRKIVDVKK